MRKFGNKVGSSRGRRRTAWTSGGRGWRRIWWATVVRQHRGERQTRFDHRPGAGDGADELPSDCAESLGRGDSVKVEYLISCFLAREADAPPEQCDWYTLPPKPGSSAARRKRSAFAQAARAYLATARAAKLQSRSDEVVGVTTCKLLEYPEAATDAAPVGDVLVGSVAPLAQCSDWNDGTREERRRRSPTFAPRSTSETGR